MVDVLAAIRQICVAAACQPLLAVSALLTSLTGRLVPRVLLGMVLLDIPFQFETSFLYREDADEFGGLGAFGVSVTTLALVLLYLRWAMLTVTAPGRQPVRSSARTGRSLGLYLGFVMLSTMTAADVSLSLRELLLVVQTFLLYVYIVTWVRTRDDVHFVVIGLLISLAFESLVMLYATHVGETSSLPGLRRIQVDSEASAEGVLRVGGTVGAPNSAAAYLTLLIAPAMAVLLTKIRRSVKTLAVVSTGLAGLALVLTQSRGGWFAVLLSLALLWLADVHRHGRWLAVPAIATALVSLVLLFPQYPITERLTGDDQGSSRGRLPLMRTALEIIRDHPLLGVGPNNYSVAMKQYGAVYGKWGDWTYTVHNKFLLVWAETGIGGLAAFLWFLWGTIRLGWSGWKASDPSLSPLALGFTAALIGQLVHMQVDLFNARPQVEMLWVLAALVAVIHAGTRTSQPTSQVVA
jgi:O-antigen ligase